MSTSSTGGGTGARGERRFTQPSVSRHPLGRTVLAAARSAAATQHIATATSTRPAARTLPRATAFHAPAAVLGSPCGVPLPNLAAGVPPVSAKSPPVACSNDPEKITLNFASGSGLQTISRITVEQKLSGGGGYSGPVGFYLQAGGDASKVPQ